MPSQELLIMAVTRMRSGVCAAGLTREHDERSGLRWVRPVKEHGTLLPGDLTTAEGQPIACGDVVRLHLLRPRPNPPHCEDWLADWVYRRPEIVRHIDAEGWCKVLRGFCDRAPADVLIDHRRSLCLVRPTNVWAQFTGADGRYRARMGFTLANLPCPAANASRGIAVSDLQWRALGRGWLGRSGETLCLSRAEIEARLGVQDIFLAVGLSRNYEGRVWPLVIGVHTIPEHRVNIDYDNL